MKKFFLCLLILNSFGVLVLAAPASTPTPSAARTLSPPVFMQKMRPKGAKTRFFGEVKFPTPVHNVYFLHFYEFPQTPPVISDRDGVDKDYIADLFTRQVRGKKASYRLVSRLKLDQSYFRFDVSEFDKVRADFIWLVPAKRQTPILRMNFMVSDGFYGAFSQDVVFVFNNGFSSKPVMQGFHNYGNHNDSESYGFDKIDERGFRVVTQRYQEMGADQPSYYDLLWNGKGFHAVPTPTPTLTPVPPQ